PLFRFMLTERGGVGYIDANGKIAIPPTLDNFNNYGDDDFFDGLAKVRMKDGEEWYVDASGKRVFRSHSGVLEHFSEGLAPDYLKKVGGGYINREGKLAIPHVFEYTGEFSEGLAAVGRGERFGYIRKDGSYA